MGAILRTKEEYKISTFQIRNPTVRQTPPTPRLPEQASVALSLNLLIEFIVEQDACHLGTECILRSPSIIRPDIRTDVAFGDGQGTSAYINEFGELICAVQLLDLGPSGLIQAKPSSSRARDRNEDNLDAIVRGDHPGMGLRLIDRALEGDAAPSQIEFVHDQWPAVSYTRQSLHVQVQFAIVDKTIVQHYIVQNTCNADMDLHLGFDIGIRLEAPFLKDSGLNDTLEIQGGVLTTGPTGLVLAGGPGGYVLFSASLFDEGKAVPLSPIEQTVEGDVKDTARNSSSSESDGSVSSSSDLGTGPKDDLRRNGRRHRPTRKLRGLVHELRVNVNSGQQRRFTAVYRFLHGNWSRDQVHSMHLIKDTSNYGEGVLKRREIELLNAYDNERSIGNFTKAREILDAISMHSPVSPEPDGLEKSPSLDHEITPKVELFSNWGGEDASSIRPFGWEWQRSQRPRPFRSRGFWGMFRPRRRWTGISNKQRKAFDQEFAKLRDRFRAENGR
jgi:hypothetical protein